MSRHQVLRSGSTVVVASNAVPEPLSATALWVKSLIIQGNPSNTDFVYIGDSVAQLQALEPRRSLKIWGDNMDNGGTALLNLQTVYVRVLVNGESVTFTYLEGQ